MKRDNIKSLHQGQFLELVQDGRWEYARRCNAKGVVCVAALTGDDHYLIIEQFRPPVGKTVLELPAGLAGDDAENSTEGMLSAVQRELWEETGYESDHWEYVGQFASSAGLTNEVTDFFVARNCQKTGPGGGIENESIEIHEIARDQAASWLAERVKSGVLADAKIWTGLVCLQNSISSGE